MNKAVFPESVKYPVQYGPNILSSAVYFKNYQFIPYKRICELFDDVRGTKICPATIIKAERECFQNLEEFENVIQGKLLASPVIHCDETGMKIEGKRHWLHVANTHVILLIQKEDQKQLMRWEFFPNLKE